MLQTEIPTYSLAQGLLKLVSYIAKASARSCIAVAGGSGSGKSSIADYLVQNMRITPLSIDDYFTYPIKRKNGIRDWDHPDCYNLDHVNAHLKALKSGKVFLKPIYDKAKQKHGAECVSLSPNGIILLEGLHALNYKLVEEIDFGVFVDAPEELRFKRRVSRDSGSFEITEEKIRKIWTIAELVYYREIEPTKRYAKFIIRNDQPSSILESRLAEQP